MAESAAQQPVIIKKVNKGGHGGHHGGAWKIAYADFVTAMMAFFLLLWLLNSVTQEQLEGISNYFAPVTTSTATSGSGDILGGKTITEEGAAQSSTSRDAVTVDLPPPKAGTGGDTPDSESTDESDSDNVSEEALKQREEEQFEEAKEELEETIAGIPQMKQLVESLMIDNTQEGLRIQLVDQDGLAMFPSGSAEMFLHTKRLLELVSKVILKMPQQLSISGHTDAVPFVSDTGYSNWELSADRANSARRELQHFDVPEKRIARVVGKSDTEPFLPDDPKNARNRRLSIVLLRGTGEDNPAANIPESQPTGLGSKDEVLPGLNEIRRRQLQDQAPATLEVPDATITTPVAPSKPSTSFTLELQPRMEAQ